jgi:hypothetical protein
MLKAQRKYPVIGSMMYLKDFQTHNCIAKVCALIAATLILPALAYADHDKWKGNEGGNDDHNRDKDRDRHVATVPDGSPGIVLVATTFGAVLLFSAIRRSRVKT